MFQATLALQPAHDARPVERFGVKAWDPTGDSSWHRVLTVPPAAGRSLVILEVVMQMTVAGTTVGGMGSVQLRAEVDGNVIEGFSGQIDRTLHVEDADGTMRVETYIYVPAGGTFSMDAKYVDLDPASFSAWIRGLETTPSQG